MWEKKNRGTGKQKGKVEKAGSEKSYDENVKAECQDRKKVEEKAVRSDLFVLDYGEHTCHRKEDEEEKNDSERKSMLRDGGIVAGSSSIMKKLNSLLKRGSRGR